MLKETMTAYATNYYPVNYIADEYEFDDRDELEDEMEESDEDTEEASETEQRKADPILEASQIREQMFLDKLNSLKAQLKQLEEGTYPDYLRRLKRLDNQYKERLRLNISWRDHLIDIMEKEYIAEKKAATKELEEKMIELKENLVQDMEEKRKVIETERTSMELSGDSTETKPAVTRKLRRRPNDPAPIPEKRRGKLASLPSQINFLLDDKEIESDLKAISRGIKSGVTVRKPGPISSSGLQALGAAVSEAPASETRIEDGKLLYEKRWFHRGQPIYVEGKDLPKFPAIISAIGTEAIFVKKTIDATKVKIYLGHLARGKVTVKRRAS